MERISKKKVISSLLWAYGERMTVQCISLLISVILSRILWPEEYGIIAIVLIFINIGDALLIGGLGYSLIQKKDSDGLDASTVFHCIMCLSIIIYLILFFSASYLSEFFDNELLTLIIRVLALKLPLSGFNSIQQAIVQKEMAFKKFFYSSLIGTSFSGIFGITLALYGFGVWALVAQYLSKTLIDTIVLFIQNKWYPKFEFSYKRAKRLLKFGGKLLVSNLVYSLEGNCRGVIIGKIFGPQDLAYYDQGNKFPNLIVANINTTVGKVLFPALSKQQEDYIIIKQMCRRSVKIGLFILAPLMIGLIVVSNNFVSVVLTEKWLPCVPFLRILSLMYLLKPLATMSQQVLLALGKSNTTLKIQIVQSIISILLIVISVFILKNMIAIAWSGVIVEMLGICLLSINVKKLIGYSYLDQMCDVLPIIGTSILCGIIIFLIQYLPCSTISILIIQVLAGLIIYPFLSFISKNESFIYITNNIKKFFTHK